MGELTHFKPILDVLNTRYNLIVSILSDEMGEIPHFHPTHFVIFLDLIGTLRQFGAPTRKRTNLSILP